MWTRPAALSTLATDIRSGKIDIVEYMESVDDWIEIANPFVQALLPEAGRRLRLLSEARHLQERFPDPASRPPLYGILLGVKDIFRVDGFSTQAGSRLPPGVFEGPEALCVSRLKAAGALILGKTVTTEFAYFEPGITRNPHNLTYTPGGSSSGSAAGVAAGFCPLALGSQTSGSVIRPAAFCGVVGLKPTFGRISPAGLIFCAPSLDHVGFFAQDVAGIALAAPLLYDQWREPDADERPIKPVLGVPDGPYLEKVSEEGLVAFEDQLARLRDAGYSVCRVGALEDIEAISMQQMQIVFAEMAQVHRAWFAQYASLYAPRTAQAIRSGESIDAEELAGAHAGQARLRVALETAMRQYGFDLWVSPAAPGPAPKGITTTGNPIMNIPWSQAGLPAASLPAGFAANNLPLGLQFVGASMSDEYLVSWLKDLAQALA